MIELMVKKCFDEAQVYPLFTTDAKLWDIYLESFPEEYRQFHNCNACRRFIESVGTTAYVGSDGKLVSSCWNVEHPSSEYERGVNAMRRAVEKAKITGVFVSCVSGLGTPENYSIKHGFHFTHYHAVYKNINKSLIQTDFQVAAEKGEDYKNVMRALSDYPMYLVQKVVTILRSNALYRAEKVLGPAEWLLNLHEEIKGKHSRNNIVWKAVATAPAGFCHPKSSMIGTLLDDLAVGVPIDACKSRFDAKMDPLQYQRPQAAPKEGNIEAAEKLVENLGIRKSLDRRYARLEEVGLLWSPTIVEAKEGSVFGHLKKRTSDTILDGGKITFRKFERDVLPRAGRIEINAPGYGGNYVGMLTAEHPEAPPILQWDLENSRNPVSMFRYSSGSTASQWSLYAGWNEVTGICMDPSMWHDRYSTKNQRCIFVIKGCENTRDSGLALFPEILKAEFHGVRATIEAYSNSKHPSGKDEGTANGLLCSDNSPVSVRVYSDSVVTNYTIDRFE